MNKNINVNKSVKRKDETNEYVLQMKKHRLIWWCLLAVLIAAATVLLVLFL